MDALTSTLWEVESLFDGQKFDNQELAASGFMSILGYYPQQMINTVLLCAERLPKALFLDPSCGNGGPGLLFCAAGFPSYNIEINERLLALAEENRRICEAAGFLKAPCRFVQGNMFSPEWNERVKLYREATVPRNGKGVQPDLDFPLPYGPDPYPALGISMGEAKIIYAWPSSPAMPLLYSFFAEKTKPGTLFILPHLDTKIDDSFMPYAERDLKTAARLGLNLRPLIEDEQAFTVWERY